MDVELGEEVVKQAPTYFRHLHTKKVRKSTNPSSVKGKREKWGEVRWSEMENFSETSCAFGTQILSYHVSVWSTAVCLSLQDSLFTKECLLNFLT